MYNIPYCRLEMEKFSDSDMSIITTSTIPALGNCLGQYLQIDHTHLCKPVTIFFSQCEVLCTKASSSASARQDHSQAGCQWSA